MRDHNNCSVMPLTNAPRSLVDQTAEKLMISRDQYKADYEEARDQVALHEAALRSMIDKYTMVAESVNCTSIRLLCAAIIEDCKSTLKVLRKPVTELL